jgi:hypothetical protein
LIPDGWVGVDLHLLLIQKGANDQGLERYLGKNGVVPEIIFRKNPCVFRSPEIHACKSASAQK